MNYLIKSGLLLLALFIATSMNCAQAQESNFSNDFARNSIFVELLGNGVLYSLNYDHKFFDHASARIGFSYIPLSGGSSSNPDDRVQVLLVPILVNYLVGNGNSRLELGAGPLLAGVSANVENETINGVGNGGFTGTIGYRLQPRDGGFLFRIGLTPIISAELFQVWGGLSLGATF